MNQPLEVTDFSGGMTDNYLAGPPNKGQFFDNLLVNNNKKPFTRAGSQIRDINNPQIPTLQKRISYMWDHRGQTLEQSERHIFYANPTYQELLGPEGNFAFADGDETNHISKAFWNNHSLLVSDAFCKPLKVFKDETDTFQVRTAGLRQIGEPDIVGSPGTHNYIYGFLLFVSYNVEGVTFEDFGPTVQVQVNDVEQPDILPIEITNLPFVDNMGLDNYDVANIKIRIYRSEDNLTTLKFLAEVDNGTTSYEDTAPDSAITDNVEIYTTGGVVDNDPPPPSKFVHIANNTALYGYVEEEGIQVPNKIRQSLQGDIDSCPEDFFDIFDDEVMGISSIQGIFIVLCKASTFRLDGFFDEQGRGGISHLKISDTVGCVSNDSIIQTDNGLFFAGPEGFYFCDGYKVQKISQHLNATYQTLVATTTQSRNIFGAYDKNEQRIWFCTQQDSGSLDNDSCFILDLVWGLSDEMTFTTASAGTSFRPTALLFRDGVMYRSDNRGFVFTHNPNFFTDPKVDLLFNPSAWNRQTLIWNYSSCALDFGTSFVRKFVPKILLTLMNLTNVSAQINSINDDSKSPKALKEIRYRSNVTWGDPDLIWGDPAIIWNKSGLIENKRMFPAKTLRCNYKQINITNSDTVVSKSDTLGNATINFGAKTMTLDNVSGAWPIDSVDYFLSTEYDNYTIQFLVDVRTSDTVIHFLDSGGAAPPNGSYKWLLSGFKKGEAFGMLSYVVHYKFATDSQRTFHVPEDSGGNV